MVNKSVSELTHDEIAELGAAWIRRQGYPIAVANVWGVMTREQPDAIGWNLSGQSFKLEAKVSRSDFLADKNKPFRFTSEEMGCRKGYIAPEGLIKPDEVPHGWWLLEVYGKKKPLIRVVKGVTKENNERVVRNGTFEEFGWVDKNNKSVWSEFLIVLKILERIQESGINLNDFATRHLNKG